MDSSLSLVARGSLATGTDQTKVLVEVSSIPLANGDPTIVTEAIAKCDATTVSAPVVNVS